MIQLMDPTPLVHAVKGDIRHRWTVLDPDRRQKTSRMYLCRCECGTEKLVDANSFLRDKSKSCGCYNSEQARERATKHGKRYTRLNGAWANMRARCVNPKHISWPRYGARGITVCPEWADFAIFREWALEAGYVEGATYRQEIDRIDNDGPYSPENCRIVSPRVNRQNKENSHNLVAFGETKSMGAWADDPRCKVTYYALRYRVSKDWDAERAITEPARKAK
jgi:hypothetical protein